MRCACPNDTVIWIAMASSAHHAPYRRFVRTQRIQSNIKPRALISGPEVYTVAPRGRLCQLRTMPTKRQRYHQGTVRPHCWQSSGGCSPVSPPIGTDPVLLTGLMTCILGHTCQSGRPHCIKQGGHMLPNGSKGTSSACACCTRLKY
jgi:hypothetical protein